MYLYLDIETIPGQKPEIKEDIAKTIIAPGQYKKPESIEKWLKDNKESAADDKWRQTALSGSFGEIICIGWSLDDGKVKTIKRPLSGSESDLLEEFFSLLKEGLAPKNGKYSLPVWVGHNITGFDLRFIWQRCVVNQVKPLVQIPYDAKPWGEQVFDTMTEWAGLKGSNKSLDATCKALGIPGKPDDIDGSKVWDYVKEGRIGEVAEYCKGDVEKTRAIHKRLTFQ